MQIKCHLTSLTIFIFYMPYLILFTANAYMSLSIVVLLTTRRNYAIKMFLKMFFKINHYKKWYGSTFYIKLKQSWNGLLSIHQRGKSWDFLTFCKRMQKTLIRQHQKFWMNEIFWSLIAYIPFQHEYVN